MGASTITNCVHCVYVFYCVALVVVVPHAQGHALVHLIASIAFGRHVGFPMTEESAIHSIRVSLRLPNYLIAHITSAQSTPPHRNSINALTTQSHLTLWTRVY